MGREERPRHARLPHLQFYAALPDPRDGFKSQFTWRGHWYRAKHEPIFTADEWERLKASFGQKSKYRRIKHDGLFAQGPMSLTCAEPSCGCKITYAPVHKKNGATYHYYRCADGRRIHRGRGEPQVYVKEQEIDLKKPFAVLAKMRGSEGWRPHLDEFRTALIALSDAA